MIPLLILLEDLLVLVVSPSEVQPCVEGLSWKFMNVGVERALPLLKRSSDMSPAKPACWFFCIIMLKDPYGSNGTELGSKHAVSNRWLWGVPCGDIRYVS